jgi:hypothetical protein
VELTLESLGLTKEELQERVVEAIVRNVLRTTHYGPDEEECDQDSTFKATLDKAVKERINEAITAVADRHVQPRLEEYLANIVFQETNRWGESKGERITFLEYLSKKAEAYITEQVSWDGKAKGEDSYNWSGKQTRLTYMVHKHLHDHMETVIKTALGEANKTIGVALVDTCKLKLNEVVGKLKIEVSTGRQ